MKHALLVTVRFHEGRYHGLDSRKAGEWPPAPARLFQALMAGAARGVMVPDRVRAALDWLETLPPPIIAAPRGIPGKAFTSYVPNNDLDAELSKGKTPVLEKAVAAIRVGKRFQPILFDAETPILYCWPFGDGDGQAKALCDAANWLYQLGRGIDMAWAEAAVIDSDEAEQRLSSHGGLVYRPSGGGHSDRELLCPRPGLRRSLAARFVGMRARFRTGGTNRKPIRLFVQPSKPRLAKVAYGARPHRFVFELRTGDAQAAFASQALKAAAALVQEVRDKAANRLRDALPDLADRVERYLIGRDARDSDKEARVRILPIPSVGSEHADMAIRRLVVYVPQSCPLAADDLAWAFAQVAWVDADGVISKELQRADDDRMVRRFERRGRRWRSLTPLALPLARRRRIDPDRQASESKGAAERAIEESRATAAVRQALRHAGTSTPVVEVRVQREPFQRRGDRAESFASGTRFTKDMLWHAEVTFTEPVAGPLLLGDGRFLGLGLMVGDHIFEGSMHTSESMRGVLAFTITGGLARNAAPGTVALAARRAMIARAQRHLGRGVRLPAYVSGHDEDGSPAGGGAHRHIAVVADPPRGRLLYIAPNRLQRRGIRWREIEKDHRRTAQALEGMDTLRAGAAGRLTLAPTVLDPESDPLFAPARIWESVTDYHVTRHHRRLSDEEALKADIATELERRGWPLLRSDAIEVIAVHRGPHGRLSGRLRLAFPVAQRGPLLTGRTAHKGGGLFSGVRDRRKGHIVRKNPRIATTSRQRTPP